MSTLFVSLASGWAVVVAIWLVAIPRQRLRWADYVYPLLPCAAVLAYAWVSTSGAAASLEAARILYLALAAAAAIWVFVSLVWLASLAKRDASIMDIAYPLVPVVAVAVVAVLPGGIGAHAWLVLGAAALWAFRLSIYIGARNLPHGEDARYAKWRVRFGAKWWWWSYFQVFVLQGVLVWLWSVPLFFALAVPQAQIAGNDWLGLAVLLVGVVFEAGADWQLARHRADPQNRGKILQSGLWGISRHPNYFGEALVWWGFFFFALAHPWGWIAILSALYVTWFMNQGSATKMTDAYMHKHRPDYAEYAARVPAFFPRLWKSRK